MCFGKRKKLCGGLRICLKFSLRILKHSNDDDDDDDNNHKQQQTTTFCGTPLHIQIFCHKALKINENSSHNDDGPVFYEQVL